MSTEVYGPHIVQYPPDYSLCAGCTTCEIVCSLSHDGVVGPQYNRIFLMRHEPSMIHEVLSCQHCVNPPCLDACQDGAMSLSKSGVVVVNELVCTGCMRCVKACAFSPPRINMVRSRSKETRGARKCDLCSGRADGPACIQWCPVKCLGMSDGPRPEYEAIHAAFMGAESAGAGAVETGETRDPDILGELIVAGEEASK